MRHDVIVVGGSFAGLSAALYIARSKLSVLVIDAGKPRNRFAEASHGFLGQDGAKPAEILDTARRQLLTYREVTFVQGEAAEAHRRDGAFSVKLATGEEFTAEALVLATGVTDRLPDIPGLAARWGKSVAHCPYCHGYEFGDAPLGVLATRPFSLHQAQMIPLWGPTTFFLDGKVDLDAAEHADLVTRGVTIETTAVAGLEGEGTALNGIRLVDGRLVPIGGLFVMPTLEMTSSIPAEMGCRFDDTPAGSFVWTDAGKQTSVPGLYAVGDMARGAHSVAFAVADGAMAASMINRNRLMAA